VVPAAAPAADINRQLQLLADPDERVRADSAMELGRLRAVRAVDPLAATLAGDRSAMVRESAARALALIGSSKALPALQQAALSDSDRDVRHSAQFAIEVVRTGR
jgi:HEAT repeat protein